MSELRWFDLAALDEPDYLTSERFWHGHIPFAFWLMATLRPAVFVELGSYRGDSYCAFCQAVRRLELSTRCFAVDNWAGDIHYGSYGEDVLASLREHHDPRYSRFSRLIRADFDEAVSHFEDASIDLLHVDGTHTYEAVRHDFETWKPKLSDRAVVMFHDTAEMRDNYGVWKLWEELGQQYPQISFGHSHGLGVLLVGENVPVMLRRLADGPRENLELFTLLFQRLGERLMAKTEAVRISSEAASLRNRLSDREVQLHILESSVSERDRQITGLNEAMADRDAQIASLSRNVADRDGQIAKLNTATADRDAQIASLSRNVADRDGQIAGLNKAIADSAEQIATLEERLRGTGNQLDRLLASNSWLVTKPLRFLRRNMTSRYYWIVRRYASDSTRWLWRRVPLPTSRKLRLKRTLFERLPLLFRWSRAYRNWEAFETPVSRETDTKVVNATGSIEAGSEFVPLLADRPLEGKLANVVCFYLPQFHPIPENDEWWGKGFTEWNNVTRATPQFVGHYQPRLPGELGFYDLRVSDVLQRQVELAKLYGIGAFCFYAYWFGGKRLLEMPLLRYLNDRTLDLPFCLCWANENWTRRWDGLDQEVLVAQHYSPEDDLAFIEYTAQFMRDPRYVRIGGRPLLLVYRPSLLPSARATASRWRDWCRTNGIGEIFLAYTQSFDKVDPAHFGFDAAVEFPPNNSGPPVITDKVERLNPNFSGTVYDWEVFVERSREYAEQIPPYKLFRGVTPSWDNESRKPGRGTVFVGSSPAGYRGWLTNAIVDTCRRFADPDERLVFVNAWNEWAEGAYLEPDRRYGYAFLQATRDALEVASARMTRQHVVIVSHDAHPHGAQYLALAMARGFSEDLKCIVDIVLLGEGLLKNEFAEYGTVHSLAGFDPEGSEAIRLASRLYAAGAKAAVCNTAVSGMFLSTLKRAGFHCVSLIHELPGVVGSNGLHLHVERIARDADRVVFPTHEVADGLAKFVMLPSPRVVIRPQGLYKRNVHMRRGRKSEARAELRTRLGLPQSARVVLGVGYADHRKGIDLFIEVGKRVLKQDPAARFVWLGHHDQDMWPTITSSVQESGFADRFLFPGHERNTDLFFAGSDVFALTSREDPFPSVVLESLEAGVPVVAFAGTGGACGLIEKDCGLLVQSFDVEAFAASVSRLLEDQHLARTYGEEGIRRVRADFSFRQYLFDLAKWLGLSVRRVSVVVPNFNYSRYLQERLRTIAGQSYPIFELIVLDDASTDDSVHRLRDLLPSLSMDCTLSVNNRNSGSVFHQWRKGVEMSRGDLVWIAEADDLADDTFLEALVRFFEKDPSVVLAYCQSRQMAENGSILCEHYLDYTADVSTTKWETQYIEDGIAEIETALAVKNTIPNVSGVLFSRDVLLESLLTIEKDLAGYKVAGDWRVYLEVLKRGRIAFTPKPLNSHRRHASSVTVGTFNVEQFNEIVEVQRLVRQNFDPPQSALSLADSYAQKLSVQFGLNGSALSTIEARSCGGTTWA